MDPDANLEEQRHLAEFVLAGGEHDADAWDAAQRLAELVLALDEWVRKGGALPREWRQNKEGVWR